MRAALRGSTGGNGGGTKARYPRPARTTWSRCPMAKSSTSIATYLPSTDYSATDLRFEYHFDWQVLPGYHKHEWFARDLARTGQCGGPPCDRRLTEPRHAYAGLA